MPSGPVGAYAHVCYSGGEANLVGAAHEVGQALQNAHVAGAAVLLQSSVQVREGLRPASCCGLACKATQGLLSKSDKES